MQHSGISASASSWERVEKYNRGARVFHWLIALLIGGMFLSNTMWESYGRESPERIWWIMAHASMGITIFVLTCLRIIWRFRTKRPAPVADPPLMQLGAKMGHFALYAFTFLLPLTGFLRLTSTGNSILFYGLITIPSPFGKNDALHDVVKNFHNGLWTNILLALLGVHVLAALYHQFIVKDGGLRRMI